MKVLIGFFLVLCFSYGLPSYGSINADIQIDGTVLKWNKKNIWLFYKGQITKVPFSSLKIKRNLKPGMSISVYLKLHKLKPWRDLAKRHGFTLYKNHK